MDDAPPRQPQPILHRATRHPASGIGSTLSSGELDIAVMRQFPGFPVVRQAGVEHRLLLREPIFVGVSAEHPLAARGKSAWPTSPRKSG
ncbi:LysR substrate-binding domain-containing protein [Amycolatopsis sp. lyj-109]|uniref:LysR substrate-binding domain-containing protein n=1 Tax=Amycolatopsis sp. lyj-109 TaxID=2789287 RepID=UPI00397DC9A3